jgi:hypothetical protein
MVHSRQDYDEAVIASQGFFGKETTESLKKMDESTFLSTYKSAPVIELSRELTLDVSIGDICSVHTHIFPSKSELRRLVQQGGFSINKEKVNNIEQKVQSDMLLNNKYILVQKGKKNFTLISIKDSHKSFIIYADLWKGLDKILQDWYSTKDVFEYYDVDKEYLQSAYEEIESLWNKQYERAKFINYVMVSEAPKWGEKRNYIYNTKSINTQFFYLSDLEAVLKKKIPNKEIFIEELTQIGLIVLDVLPFALNKKITKLNYDQFSRMEYGQLIESTSKFHLDKKIGMIQKRTSNPNVFYRYRYVQDVFDDIIRSKMAIKKVDLPYISIQGGGIDRKKLISILHK